jgi:magnesium transporter
MAAAEELAPPLNALATARIPRARPDETVADVRDALAGRDFDSVAAVAVLDRDRLAGLVTLEALLAAPPEARVHTIMDPAPPVLMPGVDQERAAWAMVAAGESALAVEDAHGAFSGLVPPDRLLAVLLEEHRTDLARLGGYLAGTTQAREAAIEPVRRRLWHRLPWLLLGLVGAMAATVLVGAFESQLEAKVLLAFFVPGVVYMADAVGTQTEALLIRGLSAGVPLARAARRELITGLALGVIVAAAFLPFAWLVWGDGQVAATVALALFAGCSIATLVAMLLPWAFHRLGHDPAFGSGPLATVIQDLLSIAIYLAIASWIAL